MSCPYHDERERMPDDDDGPTCHLGVDGKSWWDQGHAHLPTPKRQGRWIAWILLGVFVVGVGLTLGVVAMRGGLS